MYFACLCLDLDRNALEACLANDSAALEKKFPYYDVIFPIRCDDQLQQLFTDLVAEYKVNGEVYVSVVLLFSGNENFIRQSSELEHMIVVNVGQGWFVFELPLPTNNNED